MNAEKHVCNMPAPDSSAALSPSTAPCRPAAPMGGYNECVDVATITEPIRRPRFRRASEPPVFRLTDDDVEIVRLLARHRFLRSTHIAILVGRSLDRTNDRLSRLFQLRDLVGHHGDGGQQPADCRDDGSLEWQHDFGIVRDAFGKCV